MPPGHLCTLGTLARSLPEVCGLVASLGFPNIHYVHYQGAGPDPDPRNYHLQHVILTSGSGWLPQKGAQTFLFSLRLIWFYDQKERNSSFDDDHLLYVGSFYLCVSLSFSNLDQYLDFLLPCEVSLILQTQPSTKLGPARYITAITEQLSPPPGLLSAMW